jgi:hypothetical protein
MGSGTTILAAERVRRIAYGIELDPAYVDVSIRRYQAQTGREAVLEGSGLGFAEVERQRLATPAEPASPRIILSVVGTFGADGCAEKRRSGLVWG